MFLKTLRRRLVNSASFRSCSFPLLMILAFSLHAVCSFGQEGETAGLPWEPEAFERFLDPVMHRCLEQAPVPGAVFVLVGDGRILFGKGYGFADLESKRPVDPAVTLFHIASISKPVTATAVMQLVERGRLDLDADVNGYLKRFKVPETFSRPVTLRHLLTHTAGFDERSIGTIRADRAQAPPLGPFIEQILPKQVIPPGEICIYTNHAAALAGFIVEEVTGRPFDQYVEDHVCEPLGMTRSRFGYTPDRTADLAIGYVHEASGFTARPFDWHVEYPSSMFVTTGEDMGRFMLAHLEGGQFGNGRILERETVEEMHARQFTHHPRLDGCVLGFFERSSNNQRLLVHSGAFSGYRAQLCLIPEAKLGFFYAFNGASGSRVRLSLLEAVMNHLFPPPPPPETIYALPEFKERAPRFAGAYRSTQISHTTIEKVMALFGEYTIGVSPDGLLQFYNVPFVEVEPLCFEPVNSRLPWAPGPMAFREDPSGRISHMFLGRYAYEKLEGYETVGFQTVFMAILGAIYLLAITIWPLAVLVGKLRGRPPSNLVVKWARTIAWMTCLLNLVFPVLLYLIAKDAMAEETTGEFAFAYGMPLYAVVLLFIPHLTTALSFAMVMLLFPLWLRKGPSLTGRITYTMVTLSTLLFIPVLLYWNLLGFKY